MKETERGGERGWMERYSRKESWIRWTAVVAKTAVANTAVYWKGRAMDVRDSKKKNTAYISIPPSVSLSF